MDAWIEFAKAALTGVLVQKTISPEEAAQRAAEYADALEAEFKKRLGERGLSPSGVPVRDVPP
jgi:hypothetical protein